MDFYGFYTGKIFDAYKYLGAHVIRNTASGSKGKDREAQVTFRTFAPSASRVSVIGEFNGWTDTPMEKVHDGNFWELTSKDAKPGMMYKYRIYDRAGNFIDHCDPYGYGMELRPNTASIIRDPDTYRFRDEKWMKKRTDHREQPLNIYELHFGSFKKPAEEPDAWYNYEEMADVLLPYLKENGYNYIEIMPLCEYPCDESWGYQGTGFFSPTSRYGTADQLKAFVDACHKNEIGIILDFVPVHFAVDGYALANYDGTALYEYPHSDVGDSEWGSRNFMHSRGEVRSFLQSAAEYWMEEYHMDGLRMDAISRLLYWQGEEARGVNGNGAAFLREMNRGLKEHCPGCMLIAEDSTSYPDVTKPVEEGGLGFDYKWDLGWMHDTLEYFQTGPEYRSRDYHKLTFSMMYFYNERYLLPLSHDEVVHGKATILQKMNGGYAGKFPQARAMYLYMMVHPGKKLNFMGNEFGQLREWDERREQDWGLRKYPIHDAFYRFMRELQQLYLSHPELSQEDFQPEGFQWLDCHQEARCLYALERRAQGKRLAAVFNFSSQRQEEYELDIPGTARLALLLHTDWERYGGSTPEAEPAFSKEGEKFRFSLPPFSGMLLKIEPHEP